MREKEFNMRAKRSDANSRRAVVYLICILVMLVTVILDVYFITGIFKGLG